MDLKGITWVANVYHKFEALCLEAEDAMSQEIQYVENKAQTVGASVKKFCTNVMQDLHSPTLDPLTFTAADLSLNPYVDFGFNKKPKASIKKDTKKIDNQVTEDSKVIEGVNKSYSTSFSRLHNVCSFEAPSSVGLVESSGLESCLKQNDYKGYRGQSNVVVKRKSRRHSHMPSEISTSVIPLSKKLSGMSSHCKASENDEVACDQIFDTSYPAAVKHNRSDSGGAEFCENIVNSAVPVVNASTDAPTSKNILRVESGATKETGLECTSATGEPDVSLADISACTSGMVSLAGSHISRDLQHTKSAAEECLLPTEISGDHNLDGTENENLKAGSGLEIVEQVGKSEMGESCVLVESEKVLEDKPCSFKKMIRKAFSSKRSARNEEYEQLAVQHESMNAGSKPEVTECSMHECTTDADTKKSSPNDVCESEWELI